MHGVQRVRQCLASAAEVQDLLRIKLLWCLDRESGRAEITSGGEMIAAHLLRHGLGPEIVEQGDLHDP
jgi:hypothetical protein